MQFSPRLTGASGSPWVATTLSFCTPTSTAQPVPQKRQGALSQRTPTSLADLPVAFGAASTTIGMPAAAALAARAWDFRKSRRLDSIVFFSIGCLGAQGLQILCQRSWGMPPKMSLICVNFSGRFLRLRPGLRPFGSGWYARIGSSHRWRRVHRRASHQPPSIRKPARC